MSQGGIGWVKAWVELVGPRIYNRTSNKRGKLCQKEPISLKKGNEPENMVLLREAEAREE